MKIRTAGLSLVHVYQVLEKGDQNGRKSGMADEVVRHDSRRVAGGTKA